MSIPPEPTVGSTIRVCLDGALSGRIGRLFGRIGDPCQVVDRIGPNTFHLRRELPSGSVNWVERVTSWVNVPQAQEVAS